MRWKKRNEVQTLGKRLVDLEVRVIRLRGKGALMKANARQSCTLLR